MTFIDEEKRLNKAIEKLPENFKRVINNVQIPTTIKLIASGFNLFYEEMGNLYNETRKVLVGETRADQFVSAVQNILNDEHKEKANEIAQAISDKIFSPIKNLLKSPLPKTHPTPSQETKALQQKMRPAQPIHTNNQDSIINTHQTLNHKPEKQTNKTAPPPPNLPQKEFPKSNTGLPNYSRSKEEDFSKLQKKDIMQDIEFPQKNNSENSSGYTPPSPSIERPTLQKGKYGMIGKSNNINGQAEIKGTDPYNYWQREKFEDFQYKNIKPLEPEEREQDNQRIPENSVSDQPVEKSEIVLAESQSEGNNASEAITPAITEEKVPLAQELESQITNKQGMVGEKLSQPTQEKSTQTSYVENDPYREPLE